MGAIIQDLRFGFRILRSSPGFAAIAVLTLALGVGVNVAIFSFVDELWLRPMPVPQPDRLVRIFTSSSTSHGEIERGLSSYPDSTDLRAARTLSGVAVLEGRGAMYDDGSMNRLVSAAVISDNFLEVLRPVPAHGRTFTEAELRDSGVRPIAISYPFWRRAFNADPNLIGRSIMLNRQAVLVLCVLPRGFRGSEAFMVPDVWIPYSTWFQMNPGDRHRQTARDFRDLEVYARLSDKISLQQSRAELAGIALQLAHAYPKTNAGRRITAVYEPDARGEDIASLGLILMGVAGLVLLIACANVASLLIARSESRRAEIATRIALGGSRARIVRQLLTETIILVLAGGTAALLLGDLALQALPSLMPQGSLPVGVDAYLSRRGIVVTAGTVVVSLFLVALVPALLATRLAPVAGLKLRGSDPGKLRAFLRCGLVLGQVALSLVLVVSAGLLVRSLWNGLKLDPGFNAHQSMLLVDFSPDLNRDESVRLTEEFERRVEALPGVSAATVALRFPFGLSGSGLRHKIFVPQIGGGDSEGTPINYAPVGDGYFEVLGTRILRGRAIDRHDLETHARVLVINQQMAARFWPNQDAVGQLLRLDKPDGQEYQIIGVAEDGKYNDIQESTMPYFFLPMQPGDYGEVEMAIKTASDPAALAGPVRQALRALNPNAPIVQLVTLRDHMREALYIQSATSRLIGALGMLGLVLVAVGVYGLISFVVGKRTHEIGVRLALGSQRSAIFRLILRYALHLCVAGVVLGVAASFAAGRALRSLLVGVAPTDPIVLVIAGALLLAMTLMAASVPAMKAVRVNPVVALRDE